MTFKEFMTGVAYLPATVFSGMVNLVLGSTKKDEHGKVELDREQNAKVSPGLLNLALDTVSYIGRSISDFIANHKKAISVAFWLSLALAGAAALTVFLSPVALAAVTTFSIYGFSIAGVVGSSVPLQIGAVAALSFAATSLATYLAATVVNTISAIIDCFKRPSNDSSSSSSHDEASSSNEETFENPMSKLSTGTTNGKKVEDAPVVKKEQQDDVPVHTSLFTEEKAKSVVQPVVEEEQKAISCKN